MNRVSVETATAGGQGAAGAMGDDLEARKQQIEEEKIAMAEEELRLKRFRLASESRALATEVAVLTNADVKVDLSDDSASVLRATARSIDAADIASNSPLTAGP